MKVLIVDDSKLARLTINNLIASVLPAAIIEEAANGLEALERHRQLSADVIFLDITMPQIDGVTTAKMIRVVDKQVTIAVVSSIALMPDVRDKSQIAGINFLIPKPISLERISDVLGYGEKR